MKNLISFLLLFATATCVYGQEPVFDLSQLEPPLQEGYLVSLPSLAVQGDHLMDADTSLQKFPDPGKSPRKSQDKNQPLGWFKGITYLVQEGTPVYAVADGRFSRVLFLPFRDGFSLQLRHANGLRSEYITISHLQVQEGQRVNKGDLLGFTDEDQFHFQLKFKKQILEAPAHFYQKNKIVLKPF